ncbi:MAG: hypothetical protein IKQ91_05860 [Oscillospiraceae bacterium]|nr:hypothetical protein [Oscillospiraceae bacterium]
MYDKRIAEPEYAARIEKKRRHLRNANTIIGGFGCLGTVLGGVFYLMMTAGLTLWLGVPALVICLFVIPGVFRLCARTGRHKLLLHIVRTLGITLFAAVWLVPLICIRFDRVPLLYPVKHFVFQCGVKAYPYRGTILPAFLPKKHDDYVFRTEPGMVAQDYHPYEYLFIHTDAETLRAFEQKLSGDPDCERQENRSYSPEEVQEMLENGEIRSADWAAYQNIPQWVYESIRNGADINDDLTYAVVYRSEGGSFGAVLNYETGLLVIWG